MLLLRGAEALLTRLCDPGSREHVGAATVGAFVLVYALYGALAKGSQDVHFDLGELIAWSHSPALGYKHPPLMVWIAQAWFAIFPRADWAAYLLAETIIGASLWVAWRLFGDWLDDEKRVVALAMLTLIPLLPFHGLVFNANTVTVPFWAATTFFFLRSFRTRSNAAAAATGFFAGCAVLGKYWSIFLVAGLGLAALQDPRRRDYFRSAAPWIASAVGLLVLAPHLYWFATGGRASLEFAVTTAAVESARRSRTFSYLAGSIGYALAPLIIFALTRPSRVALRDRLWPSDIDDRFVAVAFWAPLLLPALLNLFVPMRLSPLWTFPNWTLLPVVLLASPLVVVPRRLALGVLAFAIAVPLAALVASPIVAAVTHWSGRAAEKAHYRMLTERVERQWRELTPLPIRLVGGERLIVHGMAFYFRDPVVQPDAYVIDEQRGLFDIGRTGAAGERIVREGLVVVCQTTSTGCVRQLDAVAQSFPGKREAFALRRSYLGVPGQPMSYTTLLVPPAR